MEHNLKGMSPRALLFSSDQEASLITGQVLRAIGLEVEHCPEIFSAVEQLTAHSFDVLIGDLDDGAEADFLFKTSCDLSSNRDALRIALSSKKESARAGIASVLTKPLVADRVRSTLLKSEEFLRKLGGALPAPAVEKRQAEGDAKRKPEAVITHYEPEAAPVVSLAETSSARFQNEASSVRANTTSSWTTRRKLENRSLLDGHLRQPSRRPPPSRSSLVRQVILGATLLLLAYVGIQPARGEAVVTSVAVIYAKAVQSAGSWLQTTPAHKEVADEIAQSDPQPYESSAITRINVKPSPAIPFYGQVTVGASASEPQPAPIEVPADATAKIPDSLRQTFDPDETAQADAERPSRSATPLADLMQPVSLPEIQSQKLLVQKVTPSYPQEALKAGLQGPVTLQAHIGADGKIQDLKLVSGSLVLGEAASVAVRQWRYKPYLLNGKAVATETTITVDFHLPQMVSTAVPGH
jgi:TonB family protein